MFVKILIKIAVTIIAILIIAILVDAISFSFEIPYHDLTLILKESDYFWFDGKHLALTPCVPALAYMCIMIAVVPFTKDNKVPKAFHKSGNLLGIISMAFLVLFSILSLIINFYLIFFSPYIICKDPPALSGYYAINTTVCKTIVNHVLN